MEKEIAALDRVDFYVSAAQNFKGVTYLNQIEQREDEAKIRNIIVEQLDRTLRLASAPELSPVEEKAQVWLRESSAAIHSGGSGFAVLRPTSPSKSPSGSFFLCDRRPMRVVAVLHPCQLVMFRMTDSLPRPAAEGIDLWRFYISYSLEFLWLYFMQPSQP